MRSPVVAAALATIVVGCASPSTPPAPTTITIDLDPGTSPLFLAIRDGDPADGARWQIRAEGEHATTFPIDGPQYAVFAACEATAPDGHVVQRYTARYDRTLADATEFAVVCGASSDDGARTHATGTMVQAGDAVLGFEPLHSDTANWTLDTTVSKLYTTVLALTADRFAIRRGLDTSGDETALGTLDVDGTDGGARTPVTLAVAGFDPSETLDASVELRLGTATYDAALPDLSFATLPDGAFAPGDAQSWSVGALAAGSTPENSTERGVSLDWRSALPTTYTLPAPIAGAAFDHLAVSWTSLPDELDDLYFRQTAIIDQVYVDNAVSATRNALAGGTTIDGNISDTPNFDPSWQVVMGAAQGYSASLYASHDVDGTGAIAPYVIAAHTNSAH